MSTAAPTTVDPGERLLDDLEALVRRHRALRNADSGPLHTELITAEVAMQLAVARRRSLRCSALHTVPTSLVV